MSNKRKIGKRAAQAAAFTVGGGIALAFGMAGSAHADEVTVQDANVTNSGAAAANSGGNVAVGNASQNTATSTQTANGGLIGSNSGGASNHSKGTASVTTGAATAQGSVASTHVDQAAQGSGDPGVVVTAQDADVANAGAAAANSGGNFAAGNASDNDATSTQTASGLVASNNGGASNASDGSASIHTGAATATGNTSSTTVDQAAGGGTGDPAVAVLVQDSDVLNLGLAGANSGANVAVGNWSDNDADATQDATGLFASNNGGASNASDGTASITTGPATATGNTSSTRIGQAVAAGDGDDPFLALVVQDSDVLNLGVAVANSGGNFAFGNLSENDATTNQTANGLLIGSNIATGGNVSDGTAAITTGAATATGNLSSTSVDQAADAGDGGLAVVLQSAPVFNAGLGVANSGLNFEEGNDSLNSAILAQVSFGLLASNVGTIDNLSDGFAMALTGAATGIGNISETAVTQES